MESLEASAGGLGSWGGEVGGVVLGDGAEHLLACLDFVGGGAGEFGPEVGEVGFAVGEGFGDGAFEECVGGGFDLGLVGLIDEAGSDELEEVGLAVGEVNDGFDETLFVAHFEVGVGVAEEVFGFWGFEVAHFDGDDADEVAAPVGAEFVEGLDAGEHEGEFVAVLDQVAELVEESQAEATCGDGGAEFFEFVEVEEEAASFGDLGEGLVKPVFERGVGVGFEVVAGGDAGKGEVLAAGVFVDGADEAVAEVGFAVADGTSLEVEVDGDEVGGEEAGEVVEEGGFAEAAGSMEDEGGAVSIEHQAIEAIGKGPAAFECVMGF